MKPPERILLYHPSSDTADYKWCDTADQLKIDRHYSHLYLRADVVFEVLDEYKKVTDLMDNLEGENAKSNSSGM